MPFIFKHFFRIVTIAFLLLLVKCSFSQEDNYTKWSFNIQSTYSMQKDVGIDTQTSYFNFKNTFSHSGGINYRIFEKEKFDIWVGIHVLYFGPKVAKVIMSNGAEYDFLNLVPRDYDEIIWKIPITYKGDLLGFIGLNETISLNYNMPEFPYDIRTGVHIDNELLFQLNSKADNNFFAIALGANKSLKTKSILFDLSGGYTFDLNEFLNGTVLLGDGSTANYNLVTNGPYLNLSFRPVKFKVISK